MQDQQQTLSLYMDWMSQPSRCVAIFCMINKIPVDISEVKILKGQLRSQEYKRINPNMRVPTIKDGKFVLYESHAILKYLIASRAQYIPEHWYPKDIKERALVDQYLDWHHTNIRNAGMYIFNYFVLPSLGIQSKQNKETIYKLFIQSLKMIDTIFLADKPYIASKEKATIADLSCYCEITQVNLIDFDFSPYPNILKWMQRLTAEYPQLVEGHQPFMKFVQKIKEKQNL
ncbi:glutathione S-transferase, amine-terminal domain protein (macronuclear) [Tetrahymena thermophila SB210]|uniref:Glutathione S-transferase, amine-terminal domain protein n=1 Tax=Tetrahymena thermophila (strain SB210) TaxID=312017 RepID=W7XJU4_TETTS|nr:glutathione S-transferase, amine-terminal domain protein [Tetrahymena thermophila SB210]EWS75951.1 glutathione S-transferase, amine-terminal domain protein [Tetrahymena thermophila SB210]|eukprot:XP_012651469.1 glutathione S-transferase, amine-terminal domain protein [Tetrahymena thermophila SB210]